MTLDKSIVNYLHGQPCWTCIYAQIDPFDWGLRCCNWKSLYCTDYCPEKPCEHFTPEKKEKHQ